MVLLYKARKMIFVKYENPEGEHLEVAKAEAPPQPPYLATPGASRQNGLTLTVRAVSLARKARGYWDDYVRSKSSGNQRRLGVRMTTWEVSRLETNENWVLK